uniref:YqgF/RNase H-like domain-containing protein n=1 Tax=Romanomermis culicivorax TaxID=13658 RepID=A0A915KER6_ROMCU
WIDDQAEESEHEQDDVPVSKRARIASDDDEEEEEEDESKIYEEMKGFVVTGDDEEEEGEGNDEEKKSDSEEEEEELLEDDEELLEENLGISVKKRKRRVQLGSDSEAEDEKQDLEKQLFEGGEDEEDQDNDIRRSKPGPSRRAEEYEEGEDVSAESGEESGVDDFIEDDEGETAKIRSKKKVRRRIPISDSALQEAREIFGDAIDLEDLYPGEDDEEEAEDVEQDEYEKDGENENERPVERRQKIGKKRTQKKTLLDTLEPSDLDRGFLSEVDKKIQLEDKPERFQLRGLPVSEASPDEVIAESLWIFKHLFTMRSVSTQMSDCTKLQTAVMEKIQQTLSFIRNNEFEVPFIAFYRKEYVDALPQDPRSGLLLAELWKIYHSDEKWCQMRARMENLARLFNRMQTFQYDFIVADPNKPLTDDVRMLTNKDIEQIYKVETPEELQDVYLHFLLYYGRDLPKMMEYERIKISQNGINEHEQIAPLKQAYRRDKYSLCVDAKLCKTWLLRLGGLAKMFGLKADDFAENAVRNYQINRIQEYPLTPTEAAEQDEFKSDQFNTAELKLKGAAYIVGTQLAREPGFRKLMRERFRKFGHLFVKPTKKGIKEIDENHPLYAVRYLKNKPIRDISNDQFLYFVQGESLGLITLNFALDEVPNNGELPSKTPFFDDLIGLVISEDPSPAATQWNSLRKEALKICYDSMLSYLAKETKRKLVEEAKSHVIQECGLKINKWLAVAPYVPTIQQGADSDEDVTKCRVLGIAYINELDQASFCAMIDGEGEVIDHLRLVHLTKRRNSFNPEEARLKEQDLETLRQFLINKRPHVIALAGESLEALMIRDDLIYLLADMDKQGELNHNVNVEVVENDLAKIYMNCRKAQQDFPDYPFILRQAVSLARRLQDPLLEFCQMCTPDEDILCLKYHPLQEMISKEELWNALQIEFINRVRTF